MCKGAASSRGGFLPNKAFLPTADKISYQLGPPLLFTKDGRESEGRGKEQREQREREKTKERRGSGRMKGTGEKSERREGGETAECRGGVAPGHSVLIRSRVRTGAPGSSFCYLGTCHLEL